MSVRQQYVPPCCIEQCGVVIFGRRLKFFRHVSSRRGTAGGELWPSPLTGDHARIFSLQVRTSSLPFAACTFLTEACICTGQTRSTTDQ